MGQQTLQRRTNSVTASELRRCSCAASVYPKMYFFLSTWWKASLADFLSSFYFHYFFLLAYKKNKGYLWLVSQKIFQSQRLWFFNTDRRCNRKFTQIFGRWEILLTQPVGQCQNVLKTQKTFLLLSWWCPLDHWGQEKNTCRQDSSSNGSTDTSYPPQFSLDSTFKSDFMKSHNKTIIFAGFVCTVRTLYSIFCILYYLWRNKNKTVHLRIYFETKAKKSQLFITTILENL